MKKHIRILELISMFVFFLSFDAISQNDSCAANYLISTNPANPVNEEMEALFPGMTNPWLNTFDFGAFQNQTFDPIIINSGAGWQVPNWTNPTTFQMNSPFTSGGVVGGNYLTIPTSPFTERDFHWEDGWELLWLGTGFYPNGDSINVSDSNRIVPQEFSVLNPTVPYMIYYNRYTGKIRLFAGLFTDFGDWQSASVEMYFADQDSINGNLRHLNRYDTPLDMPTSTVLQTGVNSTTDVSNVNNIKTWYTFDFQMGYDPCVCASNHKFNFDFWSVSESNISLYGRMITLEEDLVDASGNPIYDDGFLSVQDVNRNSENGYIMRDKLQSLVDDYNASLETYQNQLADQQFGRIGWLRSLLDDVKDQAVGAATDLIPGGEIAEFLIAQNLNLGVDTNKLDSLIITGGKAVLAQGYDFLSNTIFGKNVNPSRPSIPTASFSEMRFDGDFQTVSFTPLSGFIIPGSTLDSTDITPFNYPAYNKPLGLYATLRTPEVAFLETHNYITSTDSMIVLVDSTDIQQNPIFIPAYVKVDSLLWKTTEVDQSIHFKLKEPLSYALNNAVDINETKSKVYVSFAIDLENNFNLDNLNDWLMVDSINTTIDDQNLWPIHELGKSGDPYFESELRKAQLVTGWYEVDNSTNLLFGTNLSTNVYFREKYEKDYCQVGCTEDEFSQDVPSVIADSLHLNVKRIKMKVMADLYFDQLSYTGEEMNTNQVFTYLLFDEAAGVDIIGDQGNYLTANDQDSLVIMYPGEIEMETEVLFPNCPEVLLSNSGVSNLINADRIIVNDTLVSNSPTLLYTLGAYSEIKLEPGAHIRRNVHLKTNHDLYGGAVSSPATQGQIYSFCNNSNEYNASTPSALVLERYKEPYYSRNEDLSKAEDQILAKEPEILLYPNPTRNAFRLYSIDADMSAIEIRDLSGRLVYNSSSQINRNTPFEISTENMPAGIYLVSIYVDDQVQIKKLSVMR